MDLILTEYFEKVNKYLKNKYFLAGFRGVFLIFETIHSYYFIV